MESPFQITRADENIEEEAISLTFPFLAFGLY
jgi:hypothetical protein